jgi:hypothetical protein
MLTLQRGKSGRERVRLAQVEDHHVWLRRGRLRQGQKLRDRHRPDSRRGGAENLFELAVRGADDGDDQRHVDAS